MYRPAHPDWEPISSPGAFKQTKGVNYFVLGMIAFLGLFWSSVGYFTIRKLRRRQGKHQ